MTCSVGRAAINKMPWISVQTRLLDLGLSALQSVGKHRVAGIRGDAALVARVARHGDVAVQAPPIAPRVLDHVPGSRMRREAGRGGDAGMHHSGLAREQFLKGRKPGLGQTSPEGQHLYVVHFLVKTLTCWQQQVESAGHTERLGFSASHDCVGAESKGLVGFGSPWP